MREIKFRAWNASEREMTTTFAWVNESNLLSTCMCSAPTHELMQFTGMHNKYGFEIFEGDIVEDSHSCRYESGEYIRGVVVFNNCEFVVSYKHPDEKVFYERLNNSFRIVGNIHQHAHLLEQNKC